MVETSSGRVIDVDDIIFAIIIFIFRRVIFLIIKNLKNNCLKK